MVLLGIVLADFLSLVTRENKLNNKILAESTRGTGIKFKEKAIVLFSFPELLKKVKRSERTEANHPNMKIKAEGNHVKRGMT